MNITVNGQSTLFSGQTVADLMAEIQPEKPFAVALNARFIGKTNYENTLLNPNDAIEIVRPVVGG